MISNWSPRQALDYPRLDDDLFIIWDTNGIKWPDPAREVSYLSKGRTEPISGAALFTISYQDAKTFTSASDARNWMVENERLRGREYAGVIVSTVREMKIACGYDEPIG